MVPGATLGFLFVGASLGVLLLDVVSQRGFALQLHFCHRVLQWDHSVPVASLAAGGGGPTNAALMAARVLALGDENLAKRVSDYRASQADKVQAKDQALQAKLKG